MRTYPLNTFVHRVLIVRLAIAGFMIAVAVGVISYAVQQSEVKNEIVDLGRRGAAALVEQVRFAMERRNISPVIALREVLDQAGGPARYRAGSFAYVQVYDRRGAVLAAKSDVGLPERVTAILSGRPYAFPGAELDEAEVVRVDGRPFVLVAVPLLDKEGTAAAYVRGAFSLAPSEVARIRRTIIRNSMIAVGIVIVTSILLYPIILQLTRRLADYSTNLLDANLETLSVLGSAIAKRDSDTDAHNYRVTLYSTRIGEVMNLSSADMRILVKGSFLHDVGKLGIPDSILLKPAKLDEQEFEVMKTHVNKGSDIVERSTWLQEGKAVVTHHHEKFGGGGYPQGLKGDEIPVTARIFAVSDVFDALTSHRPYKKPLSFDETISMLEQDRGRHFDPAVLDAFFKVARDLHGRYAGREGADLRDELAVVVQKYFSAGMDTLRY